MIHLAHIEPPEPIPLQEIHDEAFKPIYLRGKSAKTIAQYRHTLTSFEEFLQRPSTLRDLNDLTISKWLSWLEDQPYRGGKRSPHTINGRREFLLCLAGWCHRRGYIRVMPEVPKTDAALPVPDGWTPAEMGRLFEAAGKLPGTVQRSHPLEGLRQADIWQAWLSLAWDSGERTGPLFALRGEWFDGNVLCIPGAVRKGKKLASYRLKPATMELLDRIRYKDRDRVFPMSWPTYKKWFDRIVEAAGFKADRRHKSQKIRRSFASNLESAGGDATRALLHTSRSVTEESYLDPRIIKRQPDNLLLPDLATMGGPE